MKAKFKLITLLAILATSLVSCNNGNNSTTGNVSSGDSNSISNVISNEPSVTPSIPSVISSTTTPSLLQQVSRHQALVLHRVLHLVILLHQSLKVNGNIFYKVIVRQAKSLCVHHILKVLCRQ